MRISPVLPAVLAILLVLLLPLEASAAEIPSTPPSGTISPGSTQAEWAGGPFITSTTNPVTATCSNSTCSVFKLTVTDTDPIAHEVVVRIEWLSPTDDLDLHVVNDATGAPVQSSGAAVSNFEQLTFAATPGVYRVQTLFYRSAGADYEGTALVADTGTTPEPPNEFRTANYQAFDFEFKAEVELPDQRNRSPIFIDQDIEPEIEIDRFGTIYIGAIRGVPGGVDLWRSDNGGTTFQYLGQPDGTQNPSPNPPSPEGGVGGGDVDLALGDPFVVVPEVPGVSPGINSTGRVYVTSLWLGSATLAVSVDRGENFVPNPFTTAQLDRQWNVARGEKTLYMSLRKLAQLELGQHDVFVAQSDDGATFTKGSFVQDPLGDGVPDDLAGNCVLTSDGALLGSFVSRDGRDLYVYRAPKFPQPGPADLPLGPLDVPVFIPDSFDAGLIFHGAGGLTTNNVFPIMAVDTADNIHISFSDQLNIYLMSCPAGANPTLASSWTKPLPLNAPRVAGFEFTRTTVLPWIRAGAPGKVAAMWYGTDAVGVPDSPVFEQQQVPWKIIYAQVENALAEQPDVFLDVASTQGGGVIHKGQICNRGLGCPSGTRELAEYSSLTIDNDGFANIAYAGTIIDGVDLAGTGAITFFTKSMKKPIDDGDGETTELDCDDPALTRFGGWHNVEDGRATDGHYCRNVGAKKENSSAYLQFRYTGTEVSMQIARGPRGGNAEVLIDGTSRGKVDFFRVPSDPVKPDNSGKKDLTFGEFVGFASGPGEHTFRLNVLNDAPEAVGAPRDMIYVDGFVITNGGGQGAGNPTETASISQGTAPAGTLGAPSLTTHTVAASAETNLLSGVLEYEDGTNLDLRLLDPIGSLVASATSALPTEGLRHTPAAPGVYTFAVVNATGSSAPYRLHIVTTNESAGGLAAGRSPADALHALGHDATTDPFDAQAVLSYSLERPGRVVIRVYNVAGQVVRTFTEDSPSGRHAIRWDGRLDDGRRVSSGVYFYRATLPDGKETVHRTAILR